MTHSDEEVLDQARIKGSWLPSNLEAVLPASCTSHRISDMTALLAEAAQVEDASKDLKLPQVEEEQDKPGEADSPRYGPAALYALCWFRKV